MKKKILLPAAAVALGAVSVTVPMLATSQTAQAAIIIKPSTTDATNKYYSVYFVVDGFVISSQNVKYGGDARVPSYKPSKPGYVFDGWDSDGKNITSNTYIRAKFKASGTQPVTKNYTVQFKTDGKILKTQVVKEGTSATAPSVPTKTGYTFTGWDKSFSNIKSDLTVNALWKANTYTVTFADGQGRILKTQTVEYGKSATAPANPVREGYTFAGWDRSFSNITGNTVVNAKWTANATPQPKTYTVTFTDGLGKTLKTQTVESGKGATAPAAPTRTGYLFTGWDKSFSNITTNTTVNAKWMVNPIVNYTVTFTDGLGKTLKTQTVASGKAATAPANPTRVGYTFAGWDKSFTNITGNITVNAKWTANKTYTVTFVSDGKTLKTQTVEAGKSATAPATPIKTGYTFAGWDKSFNNITTNIVVYAKFNINKYIVTFIDGFGKILSTQTVEYGKAATTPAIPTKAGYIFDGWDRSYSSITTNTTVAAKWRMAGPTYNIYTVTFMVDGKVFAVRTVAAGARASVPIAPAKTGYTFSKWDKDTSKVTSDMTVNAVYTANKYTVKFVSDGTVLSTQTVEYGKSATAPATPVKTGYTFAGWDKAYSNITGNTTVTAKWTAVTKYVVNFTDGQGKLLKSESVASGGKATAPAIPTRSGYTFTGWDRAFDKITGNLTVNATWKANAEYVTANISDGWYEIVSFANEKYALDVDGAKADNDQNIQVWTRNSSPAQKFYIKKLDATTWTIQCGTPGSLNHVDILNGASKGNAKQHEWNNANAEKWEILKFTDGTYGFKNKASGEMLDISGNDTFENGRNVWGYPYLKGDIGQKWKLNAVAAPDISGTFKMNIKGQANQVIDTAGANYENDTNLIIWESNNGNQQRVKFEKIGVNLYHLKLMHSGKYIKDTGSSIKQGYGSGTEFNWIPVWNGDGTISFKNAKTGRFMGFTGTGNSSASTSQTNNTDLSKFNLRLASIQQYISDGVYEIKNLGNSLSLGFTSNANSNRLISTNDGSAITKGKRLFKIRHLGENKYSITAGVSRYKKSIAYPENKHASGTEMILWDNIDGSASQTFYVYRDDKGFVMRHTGGWEILKGGSSGSVVKTQLDDATAYSRFNFNRSSGWLIENGFKYYYNENGATPRHGIDVSAWQEEINWSKVKATGRVDFAFIRANHVTSKDKYCSANITGCVNNGIPFGIYFYSSATSTSALKNEIDIAISMLGGRYPSMGIAYDVEDTVHHSMSKAKLTELINYFKSYVKNKGYEPILYVNPSVTTQIKATDYGIKWWVPSYFTNKTSDTNLLDVLSAKYKGAWMWQYSDEYKAKINGIPVWDTLDVDTILY